MYKHHCHVLKEHPDGKATLVLEGGTCLTLDGGDLSRRISEAADLLHRLGENVVSVTAVPFHNDCKLVVGLNDVYYLILTRKPSGLIP